MRSLVFVLLLSYAALVLGETPKQIQSAWAFPGFDPKDPMALLRELIEHHQAAQGYSLDGSVRKPGSNSSVGPGADRMGACWKDAINREPHVPNYCPPGQEHRTGYCYDSCKPGYSNAGPDFTPACWEDCKPGYEDSLGGFCTRPQLTVPANNSACPIYDKCGLIGHKGCAVCPPPPEGYDAFRQDGCQCRASPDGYTKDTYIRGYSWPTCEPKEVFEGGFCQDQCPKKYYPVGPVCWQECPKSRPHDAGALCCKDKESCTEFIINMSKASVQLVAVAVEFGFDLVATEDLVKKMIETASTFAFFKCTRYTIG